MYFKDFSCLEGIKCAKDKRVLFVEFATTVAHVVWKHWKRSLACKCNDNDGAFGVVALKK